MVYCRRVSLSSGSLATFSVISPRPDGWVGKSVSTSVPFLPEPVLDELDAPRIAYDLINKLDGYHPVSLVCFGAYKFALVYALLGPQLSRLFLHRIYNWNRHRSSRYISHRCQCNVVYRI